MRYIIIVLMFFLSSCASLDDHYYKAHRYCSDMYNSKRLNSGVVKWDKQEYTQCVAKTANASANTSQANASWAMVITTWVSMGVTILVTILAGGGR